MSGRFIRFIIAVLGIWSAGANGVVAQMPQQYCPPGADGVASVSGLPAYEPGWGAMYCPPGQNGHVPATPPYMDGPARWWHDDLSGDRGGFYENSPLDEFVHNLAKDSYFRLEYMNWSFNDPGDTALGSGTTASINPTVPFDVTVFGQFAGQARVATTTGLDLSHLDGIRATLGVPLRAGLIEANIFGFEKALDRTIETGLGAPPPGDLVSDPQFIGTTTLTNGLPGTNIFLYDNSFRTVFKNEFWGAEFNYLGNPYDPNPGFQFRPLFGFRFLGQEEDFTQIGVFDQQGQLPIPLVSIIDSASDNKAYVPQIGFRLEHVSRWATVGVEPKFGLGVNVWEADVTVIRLRSQGDPTVNTRDRGEKIAATGELGVYSRFHLHPNFSVSVSYSIIFVDSINRPHSSIFYNDNGAQNPAAIVVKPSFDLMYYQGVNIGAELRF